MSGLMVYCSSWHGLIFFLGPGPGTDMLIWVWHPLDQPGGQRCWTLEPSLTEDGEIWSVSMRMVVVLKLGRIMDHPT